MTKKIKVLSFVYLTVLSLVLPACSGGSNEPHANTDTTEIANVQSVGGSSELDRPLYNSDSQSDAATIKQLRINHHMVECASESKDHCLLSKSPDSEHWQYLYDPIEGFEYEWGYTYLLTVVETSRTGLMADQSPTDYSLVAVVEKTPSWVDASFEYVVEDVASISIDESGGFRLANGKEFVCESEDACQSLHSAAMAHQSALLVFTHHQGLDKVMRLTTVSCVADSVAFRDSCL